MWKQQNWAYNYKRKIWSDCTGTHTSIKKKLFFFSEVPLSSNIEVLSMIYHYTYFKKVAQNVWLSRTSRSIISKQQKKFLGTFHVSNDVAIGCNPFQTLFLLCSMLCCYVGWSCPCLSTYQYTLTLELFLQPKL